MRCDVLQKRSASGCAVTTLKEGLGVGAFRRACRCCCRVCAGGEYYYVCTIIKVYWIGPNYGLSQRIASGCVLSASGSI